MNYGNFLPPRVKAPDDSSPEHAIAFVFDGLRAIRDNSFVSIQWKPALAQVLRRRLPFTADQVLEMVELASVPRCGFPYRGILKAVDGVPMTARLATALRRMKSVVDEYIGGTEMKAVHERVDALLEAAAFSGRPNVIPFPVARRSPECTAHGSWSRAVFAEIAGRPDASLWQAVFRHAASARQGEPSGKWRQEATALAGVLGPDRFREDALRWLDLGPHPGQPPTLLEAKEADLLKGFLWFLPGVAGAGVAQGVARFAERCLTKIPMVGAVSQKGGNACVNVLAALGTMDAVAQLSRLARRVRYDTAQRLIEGALEEAAQRAGIGRDELEEVSVPDLDSTDDSPRAKKERAAMVAAHRTRIERLMMTGRRIGVERWRTCYIDQPLLADMARRLVWVFETPAGRIPGIWRDGRVVDGAGEEIPLGPETMVRLWHPIHSDVGTILHWRCWLEDRGIRQPFKQAHREVYLLTPAERETRHFSNRFAGHILRQHQFQALCGQRGWKFRLMGEWDSHNNPELELPAWGLRAVLDVDFPRDSRTTHHAVYLFVETGRLAFEDEDGAPRPLESIPPEVFTEVMRDVDLFAGVTSIGNVPEWGREGSDNPFPDYWNVFSFGELTPTAESRRELLGRLLPKLAIAARCRLEDRYLVVRGDRACYRIHLGSGNVLLEPGSRYLCIVPGGAAKGDARSVQLPFEGDETLGVILSKAFLLANDRQIRDASILSQLPPLE